MVDVGSGTPGSETKGGDLWTVLKDRFEDWVRTGGVGCLGVSSRVLKRVEPRKRQEDR